MSKKKNQDKKQSSKTAKKENIHTEEKKNLQEEKIDKKEDKSPPTTEELLAIEKDKNLRLFAECDNCRRRTAKERIDLYTTANQDIMTTLLPILDNLERSIKANDYSDQDGPVLIYKQLKSELEKKGLKEIENPIGNVLDTDFHEAITNIPVSSKKDKGKIVDVIEKGYLLGEKVLRYAKVVVGN